MNRTRLTRPRLTQRIAQAAEYPIALIVAPAGFGKSVALHDYLATERIDHVRYNVRPDQNTLFEFIRGFAEALEEKVPSALGSFAVAQERAMAADDPIIEMSRWLSEHLKTALTIVIDDLHNAADDARTISVLSRVIDRSSARVKWIIASRSALDLPVSSWIAYEKADEPINETDLRFTTGEALAAADDATIPEEGAQELLRLTSGWPVAFSIALRSSAHISDLAKLADGTRDMIYGYLAEQVYRRLPKKEQELLLETCVYTSLDRSILEQRGDDPAMLAQLRKDAGFVYAAADQGYRYHDLFREFLINQLQLRGESEYRKVVCAAAKILETLERPAEALAAYVEARDLESVRQLLQSRGLDILERGQTDVLEHGLDLLPEQARRDKAMLLGLEAMLSSRRGQLDIAEPWFQLAIERATDAQTRAEITYRYAVDLIRNGRSAACIPLLSAYADEDGVNPGLRASILATLATAQVLQGNAPAGQRYVEQALMLLERAPHAALRAKIYQQAAFVMLNTGDFERARGYALSAVDISLANALYEVAARAYSVLYQIAHDVEDDPIASLGHLERLDECARKGGSAQTLAYALLCIHSIEAERGDESALQRLDARMQNLQSSLPLTAKETLLPAQAMRAAWTGNFEAAFEMLAPTASEQPTAERRALRFAETAMYAMASGMTTAGETLLADCYELLKADQTRTPRIMRTMLFAAVAELLRGKELAAGRLIGDVEHSAGTQMRRLRALTRAVRALHNRVLDEQNQAPVAAALERLRAEEMGGIARVFEALPLKTRDRGGLNALTTSERAILRALAAGASSKQIAADTGRSPQTVDVHIKSICRKLGCRGRIEAISVAVNSGWFASEN